MLISLLILFLLIVVLIIITIVKQNNNKNIKYLSNINNIENFIKINTNYIKFENSKIIFCYWHDHYLPNLNKLCIQSWQKFLPDFKIVILTKNNYKNYIGTSLDNLNISVQLFSDVLRFILLYLYGGLWLDCTIILNETLKLDENKINFVPKKDCKNLIFESWLIYVPYKKNKLIGDILKETFIMLKLGMKNYYFINKINNETCLHDYLVIYLIMSNIIKKNLEENLKFINYLDLFEEALFYNIKFNWNNHKLIAKHILNDINNNKLRNITKITHWERNYIKDIKFNLTFKLNLDVIIASYNDDKGLKKLLNLLSNTNHNIRCFIYEKGNAVYDLSNYNFEIHFNKLKNIGREQETYLNHIVNNYNNLSENILMTPSNIDRYDRFNTIKNNIEFLISGVCDNKNSILKKEKNFKLSDYTYNNVNNKVCQSKYKNLEDWSKNIINKYDYNCITCWNGVYFTNNFLIKSNSIDYYANILNEIKCDHDEVSHFLERTMNLIYS